MILQQLLHMVFRETSDDSFCKCVLHLRIEDDTLAWYHHKHLEIYRPDPMLN